LGFLVIMVQFLKLVIVITSKLKAEAKKSRPVIVLIHEIMLFLEIFMGKIGLGGHQKRFLANLDYTA
jgi:hypothetical protein